MRDYLSEKNLLKAAALGAVVTLMAVPRIEAGGLRVGVFAVGAFLGSTLVGGMATAWGTRAGMCGLFPDTRRILYGSAAAALLASVLMPLAALFDPILKAAVAEAGGERLLSLQFPDTAFGVLALILWSAGFSTLFFAAASVSFFARVCRRQHIAIALAVGLQVLVRYQQLAGGGVSHGVPLFLAESIVAGLVPCLLFARAGIIPAAVFNAVLDARHLWRVWGG
ncbi:MAG: hypothetical protein JXR37_02790 [Kiritimatiellae bacterium]|nr:hypothetical protein [Kiritimatiellia bacterium]